MFGCNVVPVVRAYARAASHLLVPELPVQWPLAPQPVLVSDRLIAYYGHIRVSESPHQLMDYSQCVLRLRASPIYSACLSDRVALLTPADSPASDCFLPRDESLRHLLRGSASAIVPLFGTAGSFHEAASFALCCDPIPLLALLRQGLYDRAFAVEDRSPTTSVMTKRATVHSRCRTFTGQTRSIMGCGRRQRRERRLKHSSFALKSPLAIRSVSPRSLKRHSNPCPAFVSFVLFCGQLNCCG